MMEQAGDCIGFLGFLLYVGPCLLGQTSVNLKNIHCNQPPMAPISVRETFKKGCKQCSPRSRSSFKSLICLPLIALTNLHQCKNAQIICTVTADKRRCFCYIDLMCESRGGEGFGPPNSIVQENEGNRGSGPPGMGLNCPTWSEAAPTLICSMPH